MPLNLPNRQLMLYALNVLQLIFHGLMPQDIPATCDGCGKKFLIEHALPCPMGGLVLARHNDATKEWGALGAWALVPSAITYESKINSRTVQGEMTGEGVRQEGG